jgi:RHS repeat-associated protein
MPAPVRVLRLTRISFGDFRADVDGEYASPTRRLTTTQGRWQVPDPSGRAAVDITNPQTWNRYACVNNNPLSFTDPSGLLALPCYPDCGDDGGGDDGGDPSGGGSVGGPVGGGVVPPNRPSGGGSGKQPTCGVVPLRSCNPANYDVNNTWSSTLPCNKSASQVMSAVQNDMGQFADNAGTIFAAKFPDSPITAGGQYLIQPGFNGGNGNVIPGPGNWFIASPGYLAVTATSVSPNGWTFTTDPSQHYIDGTVSFSAANAGNGNITFSITAQGNWSSNFWAVLGPVIKAGENSTWNNMLNSVQGYCQLAK